MRYSCWGLILLCCLMAGAVQAQYKSDDLLIDQLMMNLRARDVNAYSVQFPMYDSLASIARQLVPATEADRARIMNIQSNPAKLQQFDPEHNKSLTQDFTNLLQKGIDSGMHWTEANMMRFELEKMILPRDMVGFEKISPTRLQGYIYIQDALTTRVYMLAVKNVLLIRNRWYGGQVVNILEAQGIDEYIEKLAAERKIEKQRLLDEMYGAPEPEADSAAQAAKVEKKQATQEDDEEEEDDKRKMVRVQDRKLYVGHFDDEIKIELYLRSLQGNCPEPVCGYEAIYKFGDNEEYILLHVKRRPDGKWIMEEDSEEGAMELVLNGDTFTGNWTSKDNTEYEVKLTEKKEVKAKKFYMLDEVIEGY